LLATLAQTPARDFTRERRRATPAIVGGLQCDRNGCACPEGGCAFRDDAFFCDGSGVAECSCGSGRLYVQGRDRATCVDSRPEGAFAVGEGAAAYYVDKSMCDGVYDPERGECVDAAPERKGVDGYDCWL